MLCKEQVAQLCDQISQLQALGAKLVVIGNGSPQQAEWFVEEQRVPVQVFTDPERVTYRALGAKRGIGRVFHPGTFVSALRAIRAGFRQTKVMGDATQLGGVIIVRPDGSVPARFLSRFPGDHPRPDDIIEALQRTQGGDGDPQAPAMG
jgi:hypothetical protein